MFLLGGRAWSMGPLDRCMDSEISPDITSADTDILKPMSQCFSMVAASVNIEGYT